MKIIIPKPDKQFLETAKQLKELIENRETLKRSRFEKLLRKKFQEAFGLLPDRKRLAQGLYNHVVITGFSPGQQLFDHLDFLQRSENLVIVSQPYVVDEAELRRWAAECGASCTVANEWGYYYPGHASLFFVEFTPQAKADLDKRTKPDVR